MNFPKATLVNAIAILIGGFVGYVFKNMLPEGGEDILFQAIGLGTILIGIKMCLKLPDGYMLVFMFSLILGGIFGQVIHFDQVLTGLSEGLKGIVNSEEGTFTEGLITAFMLFCIGSMTIVGALEEGLQGKGELLYVKSLLDGFSAVALTATFGVGVIFSIIPLLIFQGGITLASRQLDKVLTTEMIDTLSAVGGILIIGISIRLLQLGEINLENLLPSLLFALLLSKGYTWYQYRRQGS